VIAARSVERLRLRASLVAKVRPEIRRLRDPLG
jgi:hypothetical protein